MASVHNTRKVVVTGDGQDQLVSVTLSGGRLAPGFGDETGSSDEIELKVDLGGGNDILTVIGTPGRCVPRRDLARRDRDQPRARSRPDRCGPPRDRRRGPRALRRRRNDELSARGGRGSGIELQAGVALAGDGGDDLLSARRTGDDHAVDDRRAADRRSRHRRGRGGADTLDVADTDGLDEAVGGSGADQCFADPLDTVTC